MSSFMCIGFIYGHIQLLLVSSFFIDSEGQLVLYFVIECSLFTTGLHLCFIH